MKFAFIIFKYFPYGGAQRDMLRIARACVARGHAVKIYTGQWHGDRPEGTIEVACLPFSGIFNHQRHQQLIDAITAQLAADKPDLIVGFNRMPGLDAYYAADPCFIERAYTERNCLYRLTGRYRFFAACEKAVMQGDGNCRILLLSSREKDIFQRWYHTPDERFRLLPPSIPAEAFADIDRTAARAKVLAEFGLPEEANIVLMVGSAFVRKGLDRAIEGLAALPEAARRNTWLLAVGEDKPDAMAALAKRLGVGERIIITSGRPDIPQLMKAADMLVHPARSELAGIVLIEAMTAGLPVLVTDVCGYAVHIEAAGAGQVLPSPYRQVDLNQALAHMLESDRTPWSESGLRYTANIAARFSSAMEAELLEQFAAEKRG
ncbi:MAG TPA: glycosyltransferase family 4 protein [Novimethylophilus sp.]|uniref:glycosyltransferase family 4 protein n=1 Tax=Novimethylophilus sp. TaxID=2137426 RepID=UPI002F402B8D